MRTFTLRLMCFATVFVCFWLFSSVQAQTELDGTFISEDSSLRFHYPGDWYIHERDDGLITFINDSVSVVIISPNQFERMGGELEPGATLQEALAELSLVLPFDYTVPQVFKLASGTKALRTNVTSEDESFARMTSSFMLAVPVGEQIVFLWAAGEGIGFDELEPVPYAVADTLELGNFNQPGAVTGELPILANYGLGSSGSAWEPAIEELESLGLIASGGELVYWEEMLNSAFNPGVELDHETPMPRATNFVMGARLSFRPVAEAGTPLCGLISRATENAAGELETFLAVLVTPSDTIAVIELEVPGEEPFLYETGFVIDFHNPEHIMYIVQGNQLTVFVNGAAVIENLALTFSAEERSSIESFIGTNMEHSCVMTGAWAYALPE